MDSNREQCQNENCSDFKMKLVLTGLTRMMSCNSSGVSPWRDIYLTKDQYRRRINKAICLQEESTCLSKIQVWQCMDYITKFHVQSMKNEQCPYLHTCEGVIADRSLNRMLDSVCRILRKWKVVKRSYLSALRA